MNLPSLRIRGYSPFLSPDELAQLDLADKSNVTSQIWVLNLVFIALVVLVVSLRISVRGFMMRKLFVDDVLIVVATAFQMVVSGSALAAAKYGLGQHVWNLPLPIDNILAMAKTFVQLMFVANVFYACAIAFTKISIISTYLRIFSQERALLKIMYATGAIIVGLWFASIFATIFQCAPVQAAWDFTILDGKCYPFVNFLYASAGLNIATDLIVCLAPISFFWRLNLPLRQRLIVSFLFLVGLFACIASMVRLASLHQIQGIDVTYNIVSSLNWSVIECSLGIICVSIPPLRPLFAKMVPNLFRSQLSRMSRPATDRQAFPDSTAARRTEQGRCEDGGEVTAVGSRPGSRHLSDYEMMEMGQRRKSARQSGCPTRDPSMDDGSTKILTKEIPELPDK